MADVIPIYNKKAGGTEVTIYRTTAFDTKAEIALRMIERWGSVAAEPDGEDSTGRQQLKLQAPKDLVDRAVLTAELTMETFKNLGWLVEIKPPID